MSVVTRASLSRRSTSSFEYLASLSPASVVMNWWMLPSGSTRPDQPTWLAVKSPAVWSDSMVANSLEVIEMLIPASAAIDWITCMSCRLTGVLGACTSRSMPFS